jgi:hypothetical protein
MGLLAGTLLLSLAAFADKVPVVNTVEPGEADPGATVLAKGVSLDKVHVTAVYLSEGINDFRAGSSKGISIRSASR